MKKPLIFALGLIVFVSISIGGVVLYKHLFKKTLTNTQFKSIMMENGFDVSTVIDGTLDYNIEISDESTNVKYDATGASPKNYIVYFENYSTLAKAKEAYNALTLTDTSTEFTKKETNVGNHSRFVLVAEKPEKTYIVVSRIDKTIVSVLTNSENRASVDQTLKSLGY